MNEQDPLAKKILERNNKPEKEKDWTEEVLKLRNQGVSYQEIKEKIKPKRHNPIQPEHYRKGEIDLFESWYRTRPFNEFRAIMESIAERYMKRDKDNRIQDLDKAIYTLSRLKEYEELEKPDIEQALDDLKNDNINTFENVEDLMNKLEEEE